MTKTALLVMGGLLLFGTGLLIGRQFPAHHFERYAVTGYLLDTSTGALCDPIKRDPYAQYIVPPNAPKDANGFPIVSAKNAKPNPFDEALAATSQNPPFCGK